jgi:hypothetical protein
VNIRSLKFKRCGYKPGCEEGLCSCIDWTRGAADVRDFFNEMYETPGFPAHVIFGKRSLGFNATLARTRSGVRHHVGRIDLALDQYNAMETLAGLQSYLRHEHAGSFAAHARREALHIHMRLSSRPVTTCVVDSLLATVVTVVNRERMEGEASAALYRLVNNTNCIPVRLTLDGGVMSLTVDAIKNTGGFFSIAGESY